MVNALWGDNMRNGILENLKRGKGKEVAVLVDNEGFDPSPSFPSGVVNLSLQIQILSQLMEHPALRLSSSRPAKAVSLSRYI
jgi:hypothetical protein